MPFSASPQVEHRSRVHLSALQGVNPQRRYRRDGLMVDGLADRAKRLRLSNRSN